MKSQSAKRFFGNYISKLQEASSIKVSTLNFPLRQKGSRASACRCYPINYSGKFSSNDSELGLYLSLQR